MEQTQSDSIRQRIEASIRKLEIAQIRFDKARPLSIFELSTVSLKYQYHESSFEVPAVAVSKSWLLTVVHSAHAEIALNSSIQLSFGKQILRVLMMRIIQVKDVYPDLPYSLLAINIEQEIQVTFGYNLSPLPYQQRRTQLMRIQTSQTNNVSYYVFNNQQNRLISGIHLHPFADPQHNFIMQNSALPFIQTGSPILQQRGHEYFLIGFYCSRRQVPIEDYHYILIFNFNIHLKLQQNLPKRAAERCLLSFTLRNSRITTIHIRQLAARQFTTLVMLDLGSNRLGPSGVKHLVKGNFRHLTDITLDGNQVDDTAINCLVKANWPELHSLSLVNNCIRSVGAHFMAKARWNQLTFLNLYKNKLDSKGVFFLLLGDWMILSILTIERCETLHTNTHLISTCFSSKYTMMTKFTII